MKKMNVLVTGASSGIGLATVEAFAKEGKNIIATARRQDRLTALSESMKTKYGANVLPLVMDVSDNNSVNTAIESLDNDWKSIDIIVNNAGLAISTNKIQDGNPKDWDCMIDTNIKGLLYVTRAILPGMISRGAGHVINIGSIAGHEYYPGGNIYCATKHAVKAITKNLRIDLLGTPIRVSSVDPGAVATEFSEVRWNSKERSDQFYAEFDALKPEDIADAVAYCANTPQHVNIAEMIVMPTCQASVNHLHRSKSNDSHSGIFKD